MVGEGSNVNTKWQRQHYMWDATLFLKWEYSGWAAVSDIKILKNNMIP